jgi:hypothetical protein
MRCVHLGETQIHANRNGRASADEPGDHPGARGRLPAFRCVPRALGSSHHRPRNLAGIARAIPGSRPGSTPQSSRLRTSQPRPASPQWSLSRRNGHLHLGTAWHHIAGDLPPFDRRVARRARPVQDSARGSWACSARRPGRASYPSAKSHRPRGVDRCVSGLRAASNQVLGVSGSLLVGTVDKCPAKEKVLCCVRVRCEEQYLLA